MSGFLKTLTALAQGRYGPGLPARPARTATQHPDPGEIFQEADTTSNVSNPASGHRLMPPQSAHVDIPAVHSVAPTNPQVNEAPRDQSTSVFETVFNDPIQGADERVAVPRPQDVPETAPESAMRVGEVQNEPDFDVPEDGSKPQADTEVSQRFASYAQARAIPLILSQMAENDARHDAPTPQAPIIERQGDQFPQAPTRTINEVPADVQPPPDHVRPLNAPIQQNSTLEIGELSISIAPPPQEPASAHVPQLRRSASISPSAVIRRAGIRRL